MKSLKVGLKFQHKFWLDIRGKVLKAEVTKIDGDKISFKQIDPEGMEFAVPKYEFLAKHYGKRLRKDD
jgi:hypothetical protein